MVPGTGPGIYLGYDLSHFGGGQKSLPTFSEAQQVQAKQCSSRAGRFDLVLVGPIGRSGLVGPPQTSAPPVWVGGVCEAVGPVGLAFGTSRSVLGLALDRPEA